jgi:hypothetical protein
MTLLKRLVALVVFVFVAVATRMIVRYGVEGAIDAITKAVSGFTSSNEAPSAKPKATAKSKPPVVNAPAPQAAPPQNRSTFGGAPLNPAAPLGAGPVNAARNAAAAANSQLAAQTGQDLPAPPSKGGAKSVGTSTALPAASSIPVVQQGAPKANGAAPAPPPDLPSAAAPAATDSKRAPAKAAGPPPGLPTVAESKPGSGAPNAKPVPVADSAAPVVTREMFDYGGERRRDPFISLMTTNDLRPTITDLTLTGVLYDLSGRRPVAIMRDIAGGQWRVTTGMTLGRMRVAQIKPRVVIFTIEEFGFNRQDSLVLGDTTRGRPR